MNESSLRPLKRHGVFSPVLIELTIVILFFALSTSIVVRLIASASEISNESRFHARALLAMESVAEQIKSDPAASGAANEQDVRMFSVPAAEDILVDCVVTGSSVSARGTFYTIALSVTGESGKVYTLQAAKYVSGGEAMP